MLAYISVAYTRELTSINSIIIIIIIIVIIRSATIYLFQAVTRVVRVIEFRSCDLKKDHLENISHISPHTQRRQL